jgi:RNA-directed DNA polymerase
MRRFVLGWKTLGHERKLCARIVNYADDFVICCRGTGESAHAVMRAMMSRLKLTVNETKTKLCRVPDETFDFLGYTFGCCYSPRTGRAFIGTTPMRKKVRRLYDNLREDTSRRTTLLDEEEVVRRLNRKLRGWANYFKLGPVSKAYRAVDTYVTHRLRRWLCKATPKPPRHLSTPLDPVLTMPGCANGSPTR